jgi:hypothetical protein
MTWDVFISYASEDKAVAKHLAEALQREGLKVWFDQFELSLGDSLRRKIDDGLLQSKFGVVILSPHFFEKEWPRRELDGLTALESPRKVVLPVWHQVGFDEIRRFSPMLADRCAVSTSKGGDAVVAEVLKVVRGDVQGQTPGDSAAQSWYRLHRGKLAIAGLSLSIVLALAAQLPLLQRHDPAPQPPGKIMNYSDMVRADKNTVVEFSCPDQGKKRWLSVRPEISAVVLLVQPETANSRWRIDKISPEVIALESLSAGDSAKWLDGKPDSGNMVSLAPNEGAGMLAPYFTGTKWQVFQFDRDHIALKSLSRKSGNVPAWLACKEGTGTIALTTHAPEEHAAETAWTAYRLNP